MRSLLLVAALICVLNVNDIASHAVVRNVAYSKPVTLSSEYGGYPGRNAVNGILSDLACTAKEKFPWLRIDLGRNYLIHEIEMIVRSDCCGGQSHDIDFTVGKTIDDMQFCGHFTGPASLRQRIAVFCPSHTVARYVQLQIVSGHVNYLNPAEVLVWAVN